MGCVRKVGDRVKIVHPRGRGPAPFDIAFNCCEGKIISIEGSNPVKYRIKLDYNVTLPDGTVVKDDLWASEYLRRVS